MARIRALVTIRTGYRNPGEEWANLHRAAIVDKTLTFIKTDFVGSLPKLFSENTEKLGLQSGIPEESVRVKFEDFGPRDLNIPNLLVEVEFSGDSPAEEECERITACLKEIFDTWFRNRKHEPDNHEVETSWKKLYRM